MVEQTKNVGKKDTWTFQGKEFKHCPGCGKGILAIWNSHNCGWNLTPEQMDEFHIGKEYIKGKEIPEEEQDTEPKNVYGQTQQQVENKFYVTKIEALVGLTALKLAESHNEFIKNHWVIATQTHLVDPSKQLFTAFVYYKVAPEVKK